MKLPLRGKDVQGGDCWKKTGRRKVTKPVAKAITTTREGPASQQMAAKEDHGGGAAGGGMPWWGKWEHHNKRNERGRSEQGHCPAFPIQGPESARTLSCLPGPGVRVNGA